MWCQDKLAGHKKITQIALWMGLSKSWSAGIYGLIFMYWAVNITMTNTFGKEFPFCLTYAKILMLQIFKYNVNYYIILRKGLNTLMKNWYHLLNVTHSGRKPASLILPLWYLTKYIFLCTAFAFYSDILYGKYYILQTQGYHMEEETLFLCRNQQCAI